MSLTADSIHGERSWCPGVSSDFLTSGNVTVYRKWKSRDSTVKFSLGYTEFEVPVKHPGGYGCLVDSWIYSLS